jgi:hypothetical protein
MQTVTTHNSPLYRRREDAALLTGLGGMPRSAEITDLCASRDENLREL